MRRNDGDNALLPCSASRVLCITYRPQGNVFVASLVTANTGIILLNAKLGPILTTIFVVKAEISIFRDSEVHRCQNFGGQQNDKREKQNRFRERKAWALTQRVKARELSNSCPESPSQDPHHYVGWGLVGWSCLRPGQIVTFTINNAVFCEMLSTTYILHPTLSTSTTIMPEPSLSPVDVNVVRSQNRDYLHKAVTEQRNPFCGFDWGDHVICVSPPRLDSAYDPAWPDHSTRPNCIFGALLEQLGM